MTTITLEDFQTAIEAIRDILYMYYDMHISYGGFGHGIELGRLDPLAFVDATIQDTKGYHIPVDLDLLHGGCGVAILCTLSDAWDEHESIDLGWPAFESIWQALHNGRFGHLPDIEHAIRLAFADEMGFRSVLPAIFQARVQLFFQRLASPAPDAT